MNNARNFYTTWKCFQCDHEFLEKPTDQLSDNLEEYLHYAGLCGEKCLKKYSKDEQHRLSVKFLLEGEGMKLKYNGTKVV
jgi:hypothetical protein